MFSFPALKAAVVVTAVIKVEVVIKSHLSFFFEFLFSLIIKKLLNGLKFYFLVLVIMIMMTSLFWFLS